jgi:hypothetical protein
MVQEVKVSRKQEMILQFTGRAHCHLQESLELAVPAPTATLSNVCPNRGTSTPDLRYYPEDFMFRKICRYAVTIESKFVGFFPNLQIAEALHRAFSWRKDLSCAHVMAHFTAVTASTDTKCQRLIALVLG